MGVDEVTRGGMTPKVSIIVPVYNVEKYLGTCLDSLLQQDLGSIEIICVDDGSTDRSLAILDEYATRDPRIQVVRQRNSGLGAARNAGIDAARGEFVGFMDSDDWAEPSMYGLLYARALETGAEIVVCNGMLEFMSESRSAPWYEASIFETPDRFKSGDRQELLNVTSACLKLFKRDLLEREKIRFPEGTLYEDTPFNYRTLLRADSISTVNRPLYHYRRDRPDAITSHAGRRSFEIFGILADIRQFLQSEGKLDLYGRSYARFTIGHLVWNLHGFMVRPDRERYTLAVEFASRMGEATREIPAGDYRELTRTLPRYDRWLFRSIRSRMALAVSLILFYRFAGAIYGFKFPRRVTEVPSFFIQALVAWVRTADIRREASARQLSK